MVTPVGSFSDDPQDVAIQPDGRLVAAGYTVDGGGQVRVALVRWDANGSVDGTFGTGGTVATPLGDAAALAVRPDGRLVVAGRVGAPPDFLVARSEANGSPDATFGAGGVVTTVFSSETDLPNALVVQPDGRVVALGYTHTPSGNDFALARYLDGPSGCF